MFQKIKSWFFKKEEVKVHEMTIRELHAATYPDSKYAKPSELNMKLVPENYTPVKAAIPPLQPQVVAPLTAEQANVVYTTTITSAPTHFEEPVVKAVDQQAVVNAAEGSATAPIKKPRKPRQQKVSVASWPFPTGIPSEGSTVTQEELEALKVSPAAIKVKKPRKAVVPKQG
jgi:hypothetical protein